MRKGIITLAMVLTLGLAVGCGSKNKTLECTKTEDKSGVSLKQTIKAKFSGNNVKDLTLDMDAVLPDAYKSYKSTYIKAFESSFASYKNLKGVELKVTETDDGFNIKLTADLSEMDDDAKNKLKIVDTKASYSKSIKELEADNYKCK